MAVRLMVFYRYVSYVSYISYISYISNLYSIIIITGLTDGVNMTCTVVI